MANNLPDYLRLFFWILKELSKKWLFFNFLLNELLNEVFRRFSLTLSPFVKGWFEDSFVVLSHTSKGCPSIKEIKLLVVLFVIYPTVGFYFSWNLKFKGSDFDFFILHRYIVFKESWLKRFDLRSWHGKCLYHWLFLRFLYKFLFKDVWFGDWKRVWLVCDSKEWFIAFIGS